jgi:2-oxoglutarate dehydrogenase E1 component
LTSSGKIYYELVDERERRKADDVAIIRLEQIAPFAWDRVAEEAAYYSNAEIMWVQEEPKNMVRALLSIFDNLVTKPR